MSRQHCIDCARETGFSLVELAVVIVVISVLLGVILIPLGTRIEMQQARDQQRALDELRDALLGFAQSQGRLPCPDTDGDGLEDRPCPGSGVPAVAAMEFPYRTLGVPATDRWGRRYVYAVTPEMTEQALTGQPAPNSGLDLDDRGAISLNERLSDKSVVPIADAGNDSGAAAIIVSLGANGRGGTDLDGNTLAVSTGTDEIENTNDDATFITRLPTKGADVCDDTDAAQPFCEFDDLVVMVPTPLLLGRLVQAGRLP